MLMIYLLTSLLLPWLVIKMVKKFWRLFVALFFAALISGCASTSNEFDQSPCACDFERLNIGSHQGLGHA